MTLIPQFPQPPQSTDPANFDARADALLGFFPDFVNAANAQAKENNQLNTSTVSAAATAAAAASSARSAADLALSSASAGKWSATATYQEGNLAWSPVSGLIYRRLVAGKSSSDPSADRVNWVEAQNTPFGTAPNQLPAGLHLGALAFSDVVGSTVVRRAVFDSKPGDVWREYVSDTVTNIKFHGFDGVIRSRTEAWT